jgi:PPK2 family polyphosphate:nucleotide phosphotransferase
MKVKSPYLVKPHSKVRLAQLPTETHGEAPDKKAAEAEMADHLKRLADLQEVLYASQAKALLIVLQGMDTAGKDGTIRHIFSGINPQGCDVASFKVPTPLEARHDFLWRCHAQVPPKGMIGIFNRSHYEDVLSPVVHGLISAKRAQEHMDNINSWERMLVDNDVVILKFFLHISRDEQTRRLQARIDDKSKHWKMSPADFEERQFWTDYMRAYEDILRNTSRKYAPWFVIPSDNKGFRNVAISRVLVDAMDRMKLKYPKPTFDPSGLNLEDESPQEAAREVESKVNRATVSEDTATAGKH